MFTNMRKRGQRIIKSSFVRMETTCEGNDQVEDVAELLLSLREVEQRYTVSSYTLVREFVLNMVKNV